MPVKTEFKSEQEIRDIKETGLISYSIVIDETYRLFKEKNLTVNNVKYKPNANGDTVTAIYTIDSEFNTAELSLCVVWTHSYHKAIRFQCNGAAIDKDGNLIVIDKTGASKSRRPSEVSKYQAEIFEDLKIEIMYLEQTMEKFETFKSTLNSEPANLEVGSSVLGLLYVNDELITTSQAAIAKEALLTSPENAWDIYKAFASALQDSHSKLYISDHIKLSAFFEEIFVNVPQEPERKSLSLPKNDPDMNVNEVIKEEHNYVSPMPSVVFL